MRRRRETGVAVIGCGYWGGNYVRLLHSMDIGVTVACDLNADRLTELRQRHSGIETETDYRRVLARDDIDAVIIATTAATHHTLALPALLADKDVLVEKPLTLRQTHGQELVDAAAKRGRTLMVGHTFLYHPAIRRMKDYLTRGEVGSVYYLHATRTHLGLVRTDVNAVWDLATHDISIFGYLLGARPHTVAATGGRYVSGDRDDAAFISLQYGNGIIGNIFVSWVDSNKMREVALIGSRARIVFDDLNNLEKLKIYEKGLSLDRPYADFGEFQLLVRDGDIISPRIDTSEPLRLMAEHFLECVAEGKEPLTSGRSGLEVVQILEALDRSLESGGTPVALDWESASPQQDPSE